MNELEVKKVPFMGTELMAARDNGGQIWAGVSFICNGIGLTKHQKDRQVANIQTDKVLSKGCLKFEAGVLDPNNATVALKLDYVPLWLAKIAITPKMERETPELAAKLEQYQLAGPYAYTLTRDTAGFDHGRLHQCVTDYFRLPERAPALRNGAAGDGWLYVPEGRSHRQGQAHRQGTH